MTAIGKNFSRENINHSDWAVGHKVTNEIPDDLLPNAVRLAEQVLDLVYDIDKFTFNSWYRCKEVNTAVGGSINPPSAHMEGRAADIVPTTLSVHDLFEKIKASNIQFDKMIIERNKRGSLWIHLQVRKDKGPARRITLQAEFNPKLGRMEYAPA